MVVSTVGAPKSWTFPGEFGEEMGPPKRIAIETPAAPRKPRALIGVDSFGGGFLTPSSTVRVPRLAAAPEKAGFEDTPKASAPEVASARTVSVEKRILIKINVLSRW